jgi:hypothetical protein
MLEAGEDPLYIARRMIRFASEDVENTDLQAPQVAVSAMEAFHFVRLQEGDLALPRLLSTWLPPRIQMLFMPPFRRAREISVKSRICLFRFTFGMPQRL